MTKKNGTQPVAKKLLVEVASIRDETPLFGGVLPNPDKVLQTRGGTRALETYEDLESDAHVRTVLSKRKRAVIAREWVVNEADDSDEAKAAAELVRRHIEMIDIDRVTFGFLDAILKGYSVGEVMWVREANEIRPAEIRFRKPQRFVFVDEGKGIEMRLLTPSDCYKGIALPDRKFIRFTFDDRYENPYGFALGNSLFWPVFFKRKGITFWLVFCDKYGTPTSVGKYPVSATKDEKAALKEALQAIANDSGITIPEGMEVSLLESTRSGIDTYETLVRYMDEQVSEVVLGETGTTNQSTAGGSRARDEVANEVRIETAKADADALCGYLNNTLVKWIIDLNMPGAPVPKFWRDFEEDDDLLQKAERDAKLGQTGVRFNKSYFMREYNLQEDDFELTEPMVSSPYQTHGWPANFAAATQKEPDKPEAVQDNPSPRVNPQAVVEEFVDGIDPEELQKQAEGMLAPIIKLIEDGQNYEDIMAGLVESYDDLSFDALTEMLERAYFVAAVWGRLNAK